jgi:hypothetical protein
MNAGVASIMNAGVASIIRVAAVCRCMGAWEQCCAVWHPAVLVQGCAVVLLYSDSCTLTACKIIACLSTLFCQCRCRIAVNVFQND